jgi:hypothetical protein
VLALSTLGGVVGAGCGRRQPIIEPAARARGVAAPNAEALVAEPARAPVDILPPGPAIAPLPSAPSADKAKPDAGKRDFGGELSAAVSGAAQCLQPRTTDDAPKQIIVSLQAVVTPSGAVSRGDASGGGLGAEELACIRRMVEGVHFAPPIENAPFSVNGTVKLQQQPAPKAAPTEAPAEPKAPADDHAAAPPTTYQEVAPVKIEETAPQAYPSAPPVVPQEAPPQAYPEVPAAPAQ